MKSNLIFLFVLILLLSCNSNPVLNETGNMDIQGANINVNYLNPVNYINWVQDKENGLLVEKEVGNLKFSLQYEPYEYIALKQLNPEAVSNDTINEIVSSLTGLQYFIFEISSITGTEPPIRQSVLGDIGSETKYFSFDMQNDLILTQESDTLYCKLFHLEPTYNIKPSNTFLLAFEKFNKPDKENSDLNFIFYDKVFDVGTIKIKISSESISNLPKLKI